VVAIAAKTTSLDLKKLANSITLGLLLGLIFYTIGKLIIYIPSGLIGEQLLFFGSFVGSVLNLDFSRGLLISLYIIGFVGFVLGFSLAWFKGVSIIS